MVSLYLYRRAAKFISHLQFSEFWNINIINNKKLTARDLVIIHNISTGRVTVQAVHYLNTCRQKLCREHQKKSWELEEESRKPDFFNQTTQFNINTLTNETKTMRLIIVHEYSE